MADCKYANGKRDVEGNVYVVSSLSSTVNPPPEGMPLPSMSYIFAAAVTAPIAYRLRAAAVTHGHILKATSLNCFLTMYQCIFRLCLTYRLQLQQPSWESLITMTVWSQGLNTMSEASTVRDLTGVILLRPEIQLSQMIYKPFMKLTLMKLSEKI